MIFRGQKDIPLSATGRIQTKKLSAALADEPISVIYASPLSRTLDTAHAIAEGREIAVVPCQELIDIDMGEWEGQAVAEVQQRYPALYQTWQEQPEQAHIPGAETLAQVRSRAVRLLHELLTRHPDDTIALVSHRVICKLLLCEVLGLSNSAFWRVQQDVCALNAFTADRGKFVLRLMNDTHHVRLSGQPVDF